MRCEQARTLADSIGEENAAVRDALCRAIDERPDVLKLFEADKRRVKKTTEARGARGTTLDSDSDDEDEDEDDAAAAAANDDAPAPSASSVMYSNLFGEDDEDDEEEEDDDEEVEAGDDEEEADDEKGTPAPKRRRIEPDSGESD
jgi:hypothetical protein